MAALLTFILWQGVYLSRRASTQMHMGYQISETGITETQSLLNPSKLASGFESLVTQHTMGMLLNKCQFRPQKHLTTAEEPSCSLLYILSPPNEVVQQDWVLLLSFLFINKMYKYAFTPRIVGSLGLPLYLGSTTSGKVSDEWKVRSWRGK